MNSKKPFYWLPPLTHELSKELLAYQGMRVYGWVCFALSSLQRSGIRTVGQRDLVNYGATMSEAADILPIAQKLLDEYYQKNSVEV
jgi:hypothetical protein